MEKIIDRIKKLIALANGGSTPEEAATAMEQVQRLMEQHRITQAQVTATDEEHREAAASGEIGDTGSDTLPLWINTILNSLAETNRVMVYTSRKWIEGPNEKFVKRVMLNAIGRESDRQAMSYMMSYIKTQINGMCQREAKAHAVGNSPSWRNSFRVSASEVVAARIRKQFFSIKKENEAVASENEMVLVGRDLALLNNDIAAVAEKIGLRSRNASFSGLGHRDAIEAGREAGERVNISPGAKNKLGGAAHQLNSGK